jgi:hypothetical protein
MAATGRAASAMVGCGAWEREVGCGAGAQLGRAGFDRGPRSGARGPKSKMKYFFFSFLNKQPQKFKFEQIKKNFKS